MKKKLYLFKIHIEIIKISYNQTFKHITVFEHFDYPVFVI